MRAKQQKPDNGRGMGFISRGFKGRRRDVASTARVPPGQYVVTDFPVLSAGPTPRANLDQWTFTIEGEIDQPRRWSWKGVSVDALMEGVDTAADFTTVFSDGGYTTNLALDDITGGKAWVAYEFDGQPLHPEHGGPARLLVPHLYFWKSAKWVRGIRLQKEEQPGFWESNGYHIRGDPWLEQRYWGD